MRRWVSLTGLARVCFFTAFVTSTGCSWIYGEDGLFPDNTARYQEAPELAVITVPPSAGTGDAAIDPTYPIPEVSENFRLESEFGVPRPTPLTSASQYETVRIQRLGDESWALVAVAPGQLWPQVRAFLTASGIGVEASDAQAGLIDTQFVELKERPLSTRFRFRVDRASSGIPPSCMFCSKIRQSITAVGPKARMIWSSSRKCCAMFLSSLPTALSRHPFR